MAPTSDPSTVLEADETDEFRLDVQVTTDPAVGFVGRACTTNDGCAGTCASSCASR